MGIVQIHPVTGVRIKSDSLYPGDDSGNEPLSRVDSHISMAHISGKLKTGFYTISSSL